ncbi:competence type IV pilus major pilin ComGC [Bacillus sp. PS06]|uniref:competence type IV pilus major pilin ComGC n=1 Tax=Bacillus sp. PS06 TaxID=2764176 RepID=UPI00177FBAFE|nr:competence type IV pilus major pilin ComGC [Bacillus sp. PS06]MBD8071336.1 prepilin-type N-terminal cleavage/methylation domain-containing protein [Bacillus sp. PS06]
MNQKGFTLVEMLIVLLVISVLLLIAIPNVTKHNSFINKKGCDAFIKTVEAQVQAYEMEEGELPKTMQELKTEGYIENTTCPKGDEVIINDDGTVEVDSSQS